MPDEVKHCFYCGDGFTDDEDDLIRCAGCGKLGCDECVEWCAPDYDPDNGDYFCESCRLDD